MTLKRKIDVLFLVAILIFAGLFYAVTRSSEYSRENNRLVTQAHEILYNLEKVESAIAGIEGSHRGFIISGKKEFLDPVENQRKDIETGLTVLGALIGKENEQSKRLDDLSQLIDRKIEFSLRGVNSRRDGDIEKALGLVSSGKGKLLMDSIRMVSKDLEREEINALNERSNYNEDLVMAHNRNYLLFSAFVLIVLVGVYMRIRRNTIQLLVYQKKQDELITELNTQNRQLDDFAHLTSHNIRSPATNIYTLISFITESSSLEDYKLIFEKLTKVSRNLNETLNELLEILQVKNNKNIGREELQFESVLNKVKDSMQGDILLSGAVVSSNFELVSSIKYPKAYLESIFHNLLSNAIKYRSQERLPEIYVSTHKVKGRIILEISDNGLGIDMERYGSQVFGLRKIFHTNVNAKGIGLFMTKTQIEALGGEISVRSEVNKGTTFTVTFDPKSDAEPETSPEKKFSMSLNMW